ncbi:MAG: hypothetical protein IPO15_08030 [Anaerolineae bacterium]|uniref:hypothetical protein n=1 Tax=Candidatus Amarolinea dominans TaxID=3140696 RepID=UPI003137498C|nr:hypothetical protein [Anaerolineae bacterium]
MPKVADIGSTDLPLLRRLGDGRPSRRLVISEFQWISRAKMCDELFSELGEFWPFTAVCVRHPGLVQRMAHGVAEETSIYRFPVLINI